MRLQPGSSGPGRPLGRLRRSSRYTLAGMTTDTSLPTDRAAARRAGAEPARPRGAAVRDPPLLRHPRDDGRRHQPGRRRARLRHAGGHRRGRRRQPHARPDPLHEQLRHARAAPGPRRLTSSGRYGVRYDPATEILITVGASEAVDLALRATCDPGDEVILHEPSYVAYVPAIIVRRRRRSVRSRPGSRTTSRSIRPPSRPRSRRGPRRSSSATRATRPGAVLPRRPSRTSSRAIAVRHDLLVYSDEIYDRLAYGDVPPPGHSRAARDARPDDPDGRLLARPTR